MDLRLTRKERRLDGVFGELTTMRGDFVAVTLEHSYNLETKIAAGIYTCVKGKHTLEHHPEPFEAFEITGLPDFHGNPVTKVLFHILNFNSESEGCCRVE